MTSFDQAILVISFDDPLNVFPLSDIKVAGRPRCLVNQQKAIESANQQKGDSKLAELDFFLFACKLELLILPRHLSTLFS